MTTEESNVAIIPSDWDFWIPLDNDRIYIQSKTGGYTIKDNVDAVDIKRRKAVEDFMQTQGIPGTMMMVNRPHLLHVRLEEKDMASIKGHLLFVGSTYDEEGCIGLFAIDHMKVDGEVLP